MMSSQRQPLEFDYKDEEDKNNFSHKKGINPMSLIPESTQISKETKSNNYEGTFVGDYLLQETQGIKGKKIVKQDKRINYRTKMCPHGRECRRRLTCTFAHTQNQQRRPFMNRKSVCKLYQMGQCHLGSACRDYHGNMDLKKKNYKYKEQICKDFLQGKCSKGNICIYIHEQPELKEQEIKHIELLYEAQQMPQKKQIKDKEIIKENHGQKSKAKKQIVEVTEEIIGNQQLVEGGFSFTFN